MKVTQTLKAHKSRRQEILFSDNKTSHLLIQSTTQYNTIQYNPNKHKVTAHQKKSRHYSFQLTFVSEAGFRNVNTETLQVSAH